MSIRSASHVPAWLSSPPNPLPLACMLRPLCGSRSGGDMRKEVSKIKVSSRSGLSRRNLVGTAGAAALSAGTGFVPKKIALKYTLGWLAEGANIYSYAAKQFWAKDGLEVTIEKGTGSAAATQAIAQGQYQFGIPAAPNCIQQAMN